METKFNFNSAICTSRKQSERLLALGLKKETADMYWVNHLDLWIPVMLLYEDRPLDNNDIPAWSLHRLIEMIKDAIVNKDVTDDNLMLDISGIGLYDGTIDAIAELIKEGYFNKEYLV